MKAKTEAIKQTGDISPVGDEPCDSLLDRYPLIPAEPLKPNQRPDLFTPEIALESARRGIAITLRTPGLMRMAFHAAWHIRSLLGRSGVYPSADPEHNQGEAAHTYNSRQLLQQLATLLPAADVIALSWLAEMMIASPPDDDIFHSIRSGREWENTESERALQKKARATKAVSRG